MRCLTYDELWVWAKDKDLDWDSDLKKLREACFYRVEKRRYSKKAIRRKQRMKAIRMMSKAAER